MHVAFYSFFFFCWRFVPLSRWVQLKHTTASSWTSLALVGQPPCRAAWTQPPWEQAWRLPIWAGLLWAWTSLDHLEWVPSTMGKGCPSKRTPAHAPSLYPCKAWRDRIQERWVATESLLIPLQTRMITDFVKACDTQLWLSGRAPTLQAEGPGFNPRHLQLRHLPDVEELCLILWGCCHTE